MRSDNRKDIDMTNEKITVRLIDNDSVVKRNRSGRIWVLAGTASLLLVGTPTIFTFIISTFAPMLAIPGIIGGIVVGGMMLSKLMRRFIVSVPPATAFVTLNPLLSFFSMPGNPNVTYGPGDHISYFWEEREKSGNLSLQVITMEFTEEVPGKNVQLLITGSMQFKVDLSNASSFIGIDESTIRAGIIDLIKAEISQKLAGNTIDKAKSKLEEMNKDLFKKFSMLELPAEPGDTEKKYNPDKPSEYERKYGILVVAVTVTGIDIPEKTQETRDALDQAAQVSKGIASMLGLSVTEMKRRLLTKDQKVSEYNELLDRWFVQSGKAKMDVTVFKGFEGAAKLFGTALAGKGK